tara:strand:- start:84 stop:1106 length:1023 start_codon:yes stop_codon:yes gene_type:complete
MGSLATGLAGAGGTYDATSGTTTITKYASNGKAIYGNGPINHNSGTFAFTNTDNYGSIQIQLEGGAGSAGAQFNNVTFSGDSTYRFPYYGMGAGITISGNLTISDTVEIKQWRRNMIVVGDVTINSGCEYDCEGSGVAGVDTDFTAGSLTINSGGTFKASSNTTTITSKTSDNYGIKGGGIFTHNNGEVKITGNAYRFPVGANYYDLTIDGSEPFYQYSTAVGTAATGASGGATIDGTTNAQYMRVDGTMKINDRGFAPYNSHKVFVNNLIIGDNTDSANATNFDFSDNDVFDGDVIVNNILINADGQLKFGDNHAGNSDALEVRGAFRNLGGASGVVVV